MDHLEIIHEYNRNIRSMAREEAVKIFHAQIVEYKKEHPYSNGFEFLYPDIFGWNENWLEMMHKKPATLTFKENKEDILYTLERLNPKYLLALYIKARSLAQRITSQLVEYGIYREGKEDIVAKSVNGADCKEQAYSLARVPVKYDGVQFTVSYKTLHDEVKRRVAIGQLLENTAATTFKTRYSINKEFNKKK